ncbi:MAG: heparinase II/III family protein [Emcibacter sp.]|nr:heparinase II/III family protein [Emcibacter sp.]
MSQVSHPSDMSLLTKGQKYLGRVTKKIRYGSPYHALRIKGKHPLRLLGTPKDPWAGSLVAGTNILANRFYYEGQIVTNPDHKDGEWTDGEIWQQKGLDKNFQHYLHSFVWLRDLNRVVDRNAAKLKAMALVGQWLVDFDRWHDLSWSPEIMGQRIINWMTYAPLILDSNDMAYRSKLLSSLSHQARHLFYEGDDDRRGLPRFQAISGLILAGLYIPYGESWLKKGTGLLKNALVQEIFPDGGVASANPKDIYFILKTLLVVRASYKAMGHAIPEKLDNILWQMTKAFRNLLHGDGRLALFNGTNELETEEIATTLILAGKIIEGPIGEDGQEGGYKRLEQGKSVIIMDSNLVQDKNISKHFHAGILSFEMSYAKQRIIVNCGNADFFGPQGDELLNLSRLTAAHSTVVLNDKNSSEIRSNGLIGHGPRLVKSHKLVQNGHNLMEASHDGYLSSLGVVHHRAIYMNEKGDDIRGEDILEWRHIENRAGQKDEEMKFDARFHLHPNVAIIRQEAKDRLLLRLPNAKCWQFQCSGGAMSVEDSVYFGQGLRQQNSQQIVISGKILSKATTIKWSLRLIGHNV